jgi:hypothetical protein
MKLAYTYSLAEYEAINSARRRHRRFARLHEWAFWLLTVANLIIGVAGLMAIARFDRPVQWSQYFSLAIAVLLLLGRFVIAPRWRRWYLRQQMIENRLVSVEINERGVETTVDANQTITGWSAIIRADEEPKHFLLWINKVQAYSIPKAAFTNAADMDQFRQLVGSKVKEQELVR